MTDTNGLDALRARLGIDVPNELLIPALTHKSYASEEGVRSQGRLAFRGKATVATVLVEGLYLELPDVDEKQLAVRRDWLQRYDIVARTAEEELDLGPHLLLGKGEDATGGRAKERNLAEAYNGVVGAVAEHLGTTTSETLEQVRQFILRTHGWAFQAALRGEHGLSWRNELESWARGLGVSAEVTVMPAPNRPDHLPHFFATAWMGGEPVAEASARRKTTAESRAAEQVVRRLWDARGTTVPPKSPQR